MSLFLTKIILEESAGIERIKEPVTIGLPFPKGPLTDLSKLSLIDPEKGPIPTQTEVLATWADQSIKWGLFDFQTSIKPGTKKELDLFLEESPSLLDIPFPVTIEESQGHFHISTGPAAFYINPNIFKPFDQVIVNGLEVLEEKGSRTLLTDAAGKEYQPVIGKLTWEMKGPLRSTLKVEGTFQSPGKKAFASFFSRLHFFADSSTVKIEFTIHNPKAAKHPGGLWDLGDPGSIFFKDLSLHFSLGKGTTVPQIWYKLNEEHASRLTPHASPGNSLLIYQDSSGGENWMSKNHVNKDGEVKNSFKGFRVYSGEDIIGRGQRANPVVSIGDGTKNITGAIQYFWQNFPKAVEAGNNTFTFGLFPKYYNDLFELQAGEQKTHTLFLDFNSNADTLSGLDGIQHPLVPHADPDWYADSGAFDYLVPAKKDPNPELVALINTAIEGEGSFINRREIIDEYGWRNFGEFYADHEAVPQNPPSHSVNQHALRLTPHPSRPDSIPQPLVSHYNNQYDCIYGTLTQFARTGNYRWFQLADQLCSHVKDIDIYHTDSDRPEFNHGLFWHTEHYLDAQTATHRCFSKNHALYRNLSNYGGGPALSHNYSTGMLFHYYLTGDRSSYEAVRDLALYVENNLAMERTLSNSLFKNVKRFKNYLEKRSKRTGYVQIGKVYELDGPGRASGNALNTLLDAYLLTRKDKFLDLAEDLIRQCVGPQDDLYKMDLLDTENRWMYTVFLQALSKYLDVTKEQSRNRPVWEYGKQTLIQYAKWMIDNEYLYLDKPEKLEFPNETWPVQDIRKCNILLSASKYGEEDIRPALLEKADFFFNGAIRQFMQYETKNLTRPVALLMQNGMKYGYWKLKSRKKPYKNIGQNLVEEERVNTSGPDDCPIGLMNRVVELFKMEKQFLKWHIPFK